MIQMLRDFVQQVALTTEFGQNKLRTEIDEQLAFATRDCPKLAAKREKALEYLGDKWILAQKHKRLETPRSV